MTLMKHLSYIYCKRFISLVDQLCTNQSVCIFYMDLHNICFLHHQDSATESQSLACFGSTLKCATFDEFLKKKHRHQVVKYQTGSLPLLSCRWTTVALQAQTSTLHSLFVFLVKTPPSVQPRYQTRWCEAQFSTPGFLKNRMMMAEPSYFMIVLWVWKMIHQFIKLVPA